MSRQCGGCEGKGSHTRWCEHVVGKRAHWLGTYSDRAEQLGDDIGSLSLGDANAAYALAWRLREQATAAAEAYKSLSSAITP